MLVIVNRKRFYTAITITVLILISLIVALLIPPVTKAVYPLK